MQRIKPSTNTTLVEQELNILANNYGIPKQMVQLFVKLNDNNYYPIPTYVDSNNNIIIEDVSKAKNKDLFIGTKNQFIYKRYKPTSTTSYTITLDSVFKTAWNKKHYILFRNGYLVNPTLYEVLCPNLDYPTLQKKIVYRINCSLQDRFDVFYIEHEWNFKEIKFNQDVYIKCIRAKGSKVIKIPYPYHSYPKGDNMFYAFSNKSRRFLVTNGLDYTLDATNTHITIHDDSIIDGNFTFVFPYCTTEYELDNEAGVGETSDLSVIKRKIVSRNSNILDFERFSDYTLTEDDIILVYNDTVQKSSTYKRKNNYRIELLETSPYYNAEYSDNVYLISYRELDDYTDCKPNKLLQYDLFNVIPKKVSKKTF